MKVRISRRIAVGTAAVLGTLAMVATLTGPANASYPTPTRPAPTTLPGPTLTTPAPLPTVTVTVTAPAPTPTPTPVVRRPVGSCPTGWLLAELGTRNPVLLGILRRRGLDGNRDAFVCLALRIGFDLDGRPSVLDNRRPLTRPDYLGPHPVLPVLSFLRRPVLVR